MKLLEGKNILITGASRGIGNGIAVTLASHGANIFFTYVNSKDNATALEKKIQRFGVKVKSYKSDASSFDESHKLVKNILNDFDRIDVLINNAGITKDNLLLRMSEDDFDKVISVNLKSVFNMTKAIQRLFLKQRSGVFIHISSVVGIKGNAGQSNYAASKSGIIGFSKSLAQELGSRNIRSNVIAPGFIETEMTDKLDKKIVDGWIKSIPLRRGGKTEDVANSCVFLSSELSTYITGQVLQVDGGMLT